MTTEELKPGDQVRHNSLGEGIAEKVSVNKGTAFVNFDERFVAEYVALNMLTKIEEPEPVKEPETLEEKLDAANELDEGSAAGYVLSTEDAIKVFREHFDSKCDEIRRAVVEYEENSAVEVIGRILFDDES